MHRLCSTTAVPGAIVASALRRDAWAAGGVRARCLGPAAAAWERRLLSRRTIGAPWHTLLSGNPQVCLLLSQSGPNWHPPLVRLCVRMRRPLISPPRAPPSGVRVVLSCGLPGVRVMLRLSGPPFLGSVGAVPLRGHVVPSWRLCWGASKRLFQLAFARPWRAAVWLAQQRQESR